MAQIARKGDTTDHGGTITTGASSVFVDGKPVARAGDMHSCPIPGHGITPITTGNSSISIEGSPVARVGDVCGCGAVIVTGSQDVEAG